jgi:hypothetical protein
MAAKKKVEVEEKDRRARFREEHRNEVERLVRKNEKEKKAAGTCSACGRKGLPPHALVMRPDVKKWDQRAIATIEAEVAAAKALCLTCAAVEG